MKLRDEILARANEINEIAARYGASNLRLFGSVARGEERPDSDIDVLAEFTEGKSYFDLVAMEHELENFLHHKIDIFTPGSLNRHIRPHILQDTVALVSHD